MIHASVEQLFDVLLALSLVIVAWRVVNTPALLAGIILFVVFGLLMALCWMRLGVPDVALAEAALGTGVTGALLLSAFARLAQVKPQSGQDES